MYWIDEVLEELMKTMHSLPMAVLLLCLLAGKSYAVDPARSRTPVVSIAAGDPQAPKGGEDALKIRELINRQAQAWEKQDFSIAAADWLPTAELTSPGGRFSMTQLPGVFSDYFKHFRNVHVTVKNVFTSADQHKVAIEWDWDVTRIRDGMRQVTHDAIIVDLRNGKIASWREYFDLGNSIDSRP
jgi:ketosteroid isomerase-like protein